MMQLSHPYTHTPMPKYHGVNTAEEYAYFKALDGKVRTHNLARHVAAKAHPEDRASFLAGMVKFHHAEFMAYFRRLAAHYYKRQQRLKKASR